MDPSVNNGATIYVSRVLKVLRELGVNVTVAALVFGLQQREIERVSSLDIPGVDWRVYVASKSGGSFLRAWQELARYSIRQAERFDVVLFRVAFMHPVIVGMRRANPAIRTVWLHDGIVEELSYRHPDLLHRLLERLFTRLEVIGATVTDLEIVVSHAMAEYSITKGYRPRRRIVVPAPVDTSRFRLRDTHVVRWPYLRLGYAGSLAKWQDFEGMCRFVEFLKSRDVVVELDVLTQDVDEARKALQKFNIRHSVQSVSSEAVAEIMESWDFAFALHRRGLPTNVCSPTKVAEAWALGLPVIVSRDTGDVSKMAENYGIGVVIDTSDRSDWSESVTRMKAMVDQYSDVMQRARRVAEEYFSTGRLRSALLEELIVRCDAND